MSVTIDMRGELGFEEMVFHSVSNLLSSYENDILFLSRDNYNLERDVIWPALVRNGLELRPEIKYNRNLHLNIPETGTTINCYEYKGNDATDIYDSDLLLRLPRMKNRTAIIVYGLSDLVASGFGRAIASRIIFDNTFIIVTDAIMSGREKYYDYESFTVDYV